MAGKQTRLQEEVNVLYSGRRESFTHSQELEEITKIIGNRGYSHARRAELISQKLEGANDYLSETEKEYVLSLLDTQRRHIVNSLPTKRKIKNSIKSCSTIYNIEKLLASGNQRGDTVEARVDSPQYQTRENPVEASTEESMAPIPIQDYVQKPEDKKSSRTHRPTFGRKLVAAAAVALIGTLGFLGSCSSETEETTPEENTPVQTNYNCETDKKPAQQYQTPEQKMPVQNKADANSKPQITSDLEQKVAEARKTSDELREQLRAEQAENIRLKSEVQTRGQIDAVVYKDAVDATEKKYSKIVAALKQRADEAGRKDEDVHKDAVAAMEKMYKPQIARLGKENAKLAKDNERVTTEAARIINERADIYAQLMKYQNAEEQAGRAEQTRVTKARTTQKLVGSDNFELGELPLTLARVVTGKDGAFLEKSSIEFHHQNGFGFVEEPEEFTELVRELGVAFNPEGEIDRQAWEKFAVSCGLSLDEANSLETNGEEVEFDRFAVLMSRLRNSPNGVVPFMRSPDKEGEKSQLWLIGGENRVQQYFTGGLS